MKFKGNYKICKASSYENSIYHLFWNEAKEIVTGKIRALNACYKTEKTVN